MSHKDNFYLTKQRPKPSKTENKGYLSVDSKTKQATFWIGDHSCIATLEKVEIRFANSEYIELYGFEHTGVDGHGRKTYKYQEWILTFCNKQKEVVLVEKKHIDNIKDFLESKAVKKYKKTELYTESKIDVIGQLLDVLIEAVERIVDYEKR